MKSTCNLFLIHPPYLNHVSILDEDIYGSLAEKSQTEKEEIDNHPNPRPHDFPQALTNK